MNRHAKPPEKAAKVGIVLPVKDNETRIHSQSMAVIVHRHGAAVPPYTRLLFIKGDVMVGTQQIGHTQAGNAPADNRYSGHRPSRYARRFYGEAMTADHSDPEGRARRMEGRRKACGISGSLI